MRKDEKQKLTLALFLDIVLFPEPLDPPCGIDEFLFSRKERMACRTYFYMGYIDCGPRFNFFSTRACDDHRFVIWMNVLFHNVLPTKLSII
jgi:hypothetical protein